MSCLQLTLVRRPPLEDFPRRLLNVRRIRDEDFYRLRHRRDHRDRRLLLHRRGLGLSLGLVLPNEGVQVESLFRPDCVTALRQDVGKSRPSISTWPRFPFQFGSSLSSSFNLRSESFKTYLMGFQKCDFYRR